ncbi:dynein assembly factor 5, axonemal [Copidosoma floridanum]|uniref:dynein assembly factor 5, axonemal n=1 Tax=Copidosoma floridanum TaxID=29053 RepID=UPI0006C9BC02|nr:dynein assembly factor 5, axonemal [Copidosoma floridanum]
MTWSEESHQICLSLQSEDKFKRKQVLNDILQHVESIETMDQQDSLQLWETFHRPIVRTLHDQMEACRDLALKILKKFILHLPCSDKNIVYVIPIITKRLGPQELIETSEEVRLKCIILLRAIVDKYQDKLTAYFEDLVAILTRTVTDKYPEVKQESCECICEVAKALPNDFNKRSEVFVRPILSNLAHQHHKVRITTIKTIGVVLIYGDSKLMEIVAGPMAERLFDQSGTVRTTVIDVAGMWMMELKDRYSYWYKLLPLLLTGMNDVIADIRDKASKLWMAVGEKYITENESDKKFKEKLDFLPECLAHYPANIVRPNLGCRTIVQQNLCKLIPALSRELGDWLSDIKVRAAQLLCILVLNVEEEITNYLKKLLPAMYRACVDEDNRVVENVELAAEYMAYFVPANVLLDHLISDLCGLPTKGQLKVFAGILRGCTRKELVVELPRIAKFLKESEICLNRKRHYQLDVLNCCQSLLDVCKEDCSTISETLFVTIFTVLALSLDILVSDKAKKLLELLSKTEGLDHSNELYEKYIKVVLTSIQAEPELWNTSSHEFLIFQACLTHARSASCANLKLVHPIFEKTTSGEADPKLRLKQYILLSEYFQHWDKPSEDGDTKAFVDFASLMLEKVIFPGLKWAAGRTAEATRTASVCCLCTLLNKIVGNCKDNGTEGDQKSKLQSSITVEHFGWLFDRVHPILVNLIEDDSHKTRLYTLQAICLVMNIGQELSCIKEEHIHQMNPDILTRLEDQHDDVRLAAVEAMKEIWKVLPKDYDLSFYYVHIEYAYSKMLTHLDDPGIKFQMQTFDCLMDLMKVHPELLIEKVQESRDKFINQKALDKLVEAAQNHLKNKITQ